MLSNYFEINQGAIPADHASFLLLLNRLDPGPPVVAPCVTAIKNVADHSAFPLNPLSLLWHCATTGFGTLAEIGLLQYGGAPLPLNQRSWLRDMAVSRNANFFQTLGTLGTFAGNPEVNTAFKFLEPSEKRWSSELLGLVFAQVAAARYLPLPAQRLYYVGLYSTLAPAGIIPVTLNAGRRKPDFIAPSLNPMGWHIIEAKGSCEDSFPSNEKIMTAIAQVSNVGTVNGNPPISGHVSTTYIAAAGTGYEVATSFFKIAGVPAVPLGVGGNPAQLAHILLGLYAIACRYFFHAFGLEMNLQTEVPVLIALPNLRFDALIHSNFIALTNQTLAQLQNVRHLGDFVAPLAVLGEAITRWEADLNPQWWVEHADNRAWTPLENGWLAGAMRPEVNDF